MSGKTKAELQKEIKLGKDAIDSLCWDIRNLKKKLTDCENQAVDFNRFCEEYVVAIDPFQTKVCVLAEVHEELTRQGKQLTPGQISEIGRTLRMRFLGTNAPLRDILYRNESAKQSSVKEPIGYLLDIIEGLTRLLGPDASAGSSFTLEADKPETK